eukprot:Awhi_evm1s12557
MLQCETCKGAIRFIRYPYDSGFFYNMSSWVEHSKESCSQISLVDTTLEDDAILYVNKVRELCRYAMESSFYYKTIIERGLCYYNMSDRNTVTESALSPVITNASKL